jgi:hypothetical protein
MAAGLPAIPPPTGTLERTRFPTAGETDVLLHVDTPGRFAVRATSPTGTALQLVDMLTGPGDRAGWPGKQDGRIDALLDTGTYKLRAFGADAASGETTLALAPFTEAGPAQRAPAYQPVALTLRDLQSQSFWLVIDATTAPLRIEAAGRSLAALKLWRDGRDPVETAEAIDIVNATPAHPLTDIVLTGPVPPGTYLVTTYGGPALPWSDGATDQPLYVRTGRSTDLLAGGASGQVGVFGREAFDAPPNAASALLTLPQPAEAHLSAGAATVALDKTNRASAMLLKLPPASGQPRTVELRAPPGQAFALRTLAAENRAILGGPGVIAVAHPGRTWLAVEEPATGGDEAPATAILLRLPPEGSRDTATQLLASPGVPAIGPSAAWRARFNLRGETALLFQATSTVTAALRTEGPALTARVTTLGSAVMNATGNGTSVTAWALSPGFYQLVLTPKPQAIGILDFTLGPAALTPAPATAGPDNPVLPLGEQSIDAQSRFELLTTRVPGDAPNLVARATPVELADGPLVQTLPANGAARIAVHAKTQGTLLVRDLQGAALETRPIAAGALTDIAIPPADHARTVAVALLPTPPATTPHPEPAPALVALRDGETAFLDLDQDAEENFELTVGQGGLYRVQTTGRLKTAGRIGTAFIPVLDTAEANGVGNNMLLQRYLRAGRYRLAVTAKESAGRLGVSANTTPLAAGADLLPGGSVRATLSPGGGVAFPIRIETVGRYHLDLLGDGRVFSARLEDADGWPLRAAGDLSSIDQDFSPGRYRLIVEPASVEARVVARLRPVPKPVALTGHGPHPLPFDAAQSLQWREPPARDDPRAPDLWTFALAGPASVTLTLDGDGMGAALEAEGSDAALGRVVAGTPLKLDLQQGKYRVAASALGRNDRLDYTITLHSEELQPGAPRQLTLPADVPFAIAAPRVVSLTTFGKTPLRAELRDADGHTLARAAGRTDDWNIALSQRLPAGRYRLTLTSLAPPGTPTPVQQPSDTSAQSQSSTDQDNSDQNSSDQDSSNQDSPDQNSSDQSSSDQDNPEQSSSDQDNSDQTPAKAPTPTTELSLFLPSDQPEIAMPADGELTAGGVQHVTLPPAASGSLLVTSAEAPVELMLTLEQRNSDGSWRVLGQSQGLAPLVAVPVADAAAQRLSVWTVDGGTVPIRLAAQALTAQPAAVGTVPLASVALPGITKHWNAALVSDPGALMLRLAGPAPGLLATSAPGQPAAAPPDATIVAQSDAVWLLAPDAAAPRLAVVPATGEFAIGVPAGGRAILPAPNAACAFIAASGLGQPGLEAGRGMGVAPGSAFALCGDATVHAWNAGGGSPLRLRLRRTELATQPESAVDQAFAGQIPPHAALPLRLQPGTKRLDVSLAAGEALVAGWRQADAVTAWAGDAALSRSLTGDWTEALVVNTTDTPAPAALTVITAPPLALAPAGMVRRFYGAAGSFELPLTATAGQRLLLAGDASALVQRPDGQVRGGGAIALDGPARVVVTHGPGPLALWIEGPGVSPWPDAAPQPVTLPQRLTLTGDAMALRLSPSAPVLLRLAGTAPAIVVAGSDAPALFGRGVALARYLPAGKTVLRLLSPQDGPLSGSLELSGTPVTEIGEGLGAPVAVPPGGAAVFGFHVTAAGPVGLGVRADPDRVTVRLLDEHGATLDHGVSMLRQLTPGTYLLEASVPPDAPTTLLRPAVLGIVPHPNPPPPEVIRGLLVAAGFTPPDSAR